MDRFMPVVRVVVVGSPIACMFIVLAIICVGPVFLELRAWWRMRCIKRS